MLERIDVISDVVCPWCFIGKRHLEGALALWRQRHPGAALTVQWHAFQLNPQLPPAGMPRADYIAAKFGGVQRARDIYARVAAAGQAAGIAFDFDRIQTQPNTTQAHRIIAEAGRVGRQDAVVAALFEGYFLQGRDLTRDETLVELAATAGLDAAATAAFLASDDLRQEVAADERMAREIGVEGVPFFIFDQRLAVSGAQPAEVLLDAMAQAAAETPAS